MTNLPMTTDEAALPASTKGIPLRSGGGVGAIVPQDVEQAYRMAMVIHKADMAPRDMKSPEKILTAIFHGLEVGLKPMQAVQSIAIVNGRPTIWGDAAMGLVIGSGLVEDFAETMEGDDDARVAMCRVKRVGVPTEIVRRFSVADAKKAGLWSKAGPWTQYPSRMLQMRARGFALRDGFADVLKGLSVREEVQDYREPVELAHQATPINAAALLQQAGVTPTETIQAEPEPEPSHDPETGEIVDPAPAWPILGTDGLPLSDSLVPADWWSRFKQIAGDDAGERAGLIAANKANYHAIAGAADHETRGEMAEWQDAALRAQRDAKRGAR